MSIKHRLKYLVAFIAAVCLSAGSLASSLPAPQPQPSQPQDDNLTVSLLTCYPGAEVYALCGHTAIRVRSAAMDSVWNYGLFDFTEPNFLYRFVKGETDYRLGGYPFAWFLPEYVERGSKVVEQEINFTQPEAHRLLLELRTESLPQNCTYRYNYVRDNCATRVIERIDKAAGTKILYPGFNRYGTFRREMRAYHVNYPWYQFGIDLVLGSGLDRELSAREEMFVPIELMDKAAKATFADGRPFVRSTRVLNEGTPRAVLPPTPWYLTPLFWAAIVAVLALAVAVFDIRRGKCLRMAYSLYWLLVGIAGIVVWFLAFFSTHEATSPNIHIWWVTPLMLAAAVTIWIPRLHHVTNVLAWVGGIGTLLILVMWPFQPQVNNLAIYPLMIAELALCIAYARWHAVGRISAAGKARSPKPTTKIPKRRTTTAGRRRK